MGTSGQTPTTQTQTSTPWSGVQPQLQDLYNRAGNLTGQVQGYNPFPGDLQAPLQPGLSEGLGQAAALAKMSPYGTAGANAANDYGTRMVQSGGMTSDLQNTAAKFGSIYDDASGQQNPYLQATIEANNRRIADKVNSSVSGAGRYGSAAHTDVLGRSMAEAADPILAQDYAQRQQQRQGAATSLLGLYQGAGETAGKWAQMMPGLDEALYAPSNKLMDLGNFYQGRANQDVANQVAKWNAEQSKEWENLQRFAGILSGAGGLGGTKVTTTTPAQASTLQRVFGGSLAGAGLGGSFGGAPGAGVGALGGGLLGML